VIHAADLPAHDRQKQVVRSLLSVPHVTDAPRVVVDDDVARVIDPEALAWLEVRPLEHGARYVGDGWCLHRTVASRDPHHVDGHHQALANQW
jgi:hypothetical protein